MALVAPILLPDQFNAAEYFVDRHVAEGRGEKVAVECGDERVTYRQLFELVNRVGNGLRKLGVRWEERVFLFLQDTPEFAACFFGAIKIGAVPVPVNTLLKPADCEYLLNNSRARVAIVSHALHSTIKAIPRPRLRYLETVVVVGGELSDDTLSFESFTNESSPVLEAEPTSRDDAAFWLYSSGSTGPPKACVHLQHDMVVSVERYAKAILNIRESDRFFSVAKLFFAYGLGNALYFPLAVGATSILLPGPPKPQAVFDMIERHRPTLFFSVPSNYVKLLAHPAPEGREFDLSTIRHAISAGEALPAAVFHRFKQRFGIEILDAIGSTEALHMVISNAPGSVRPGSSGNIIPGFEARILDDSDRQVAVGTIGNLLVKADSTCACYWNQHEKTKNTIEGHWIRTGDKYYQDADGYFWYAGRSDDMVKVSGVWVSPIEIERVLSEHPAVQEAAVVFRNDADELPKPLACVVTRDDAAGTPELGRELQEFVASQLPIFKRPRWVEFFPELPKTATGKVQRFKLRAGNGKDEDEQRSRGKIMASEGFGNLRVLSLESRRSREMGVLITNHGGQATVVASTREVPSGPNAEESAFAQGLLQGQFQVVIFMTGGGTRALAQAIEPSCPREQFVAALSKVSIVARGPKPVAVLREFGVPVTLTVPAPNTWREILYVLDQNAKTIPLKGACVAVQEHGLPSRELYAGLAERGAQVFPVPVYKWAPPEDAEPLRQAIGDLARGNFDVVLFTSSVQLHHLFRFADEMGQHQEVAGGLRRAVVGSIGPVTSETLREYGITPDLEPSHPKMGFLVKELAERSAELLQHKK